MISQTLGLSLSISNPVNEALDDLRQEYVVTAETFTNIEQAGLLGTESKAVKRTAEPARRLTVKMLLLAEMIHQNPPSPKNSNRIWIFYQLSLKEIVAKITTALGIASSLSGWDLTTVNTIGDLA